MKKVLIVAAATGLMSLAACNGGTSAANNTAENVAESLENGADLLEAEAANSTNEAGAILENAADTLDNAAANIAE